MTAKEKQELARMVALEVVQMQDRMLPLAQAAERFGFSKPMLYQNWKTMGGVKFRGKLFFSENTLNMLIQDAAYEN